MTDIVSFPTREFFIHICPARQISASLLAQRLRNGSFRKWGHHGISSVIRQQTVTGQLLLQISAFGHRRIVIEINRAALGGVVLEPAAHPDDLPLRSERSLFRIAITDRRE